MEFKPGAILEKTRNTITTAFRQKPTLDEPAGKLTKIQKEGRRQKEKDAAKIDNARRKLLKTGLLAAAGATTLGTIAAVGKSLYEQQAAENVKYTDKQLIEKEAQHLGIAFNNREANLWKKGHDISPVKIPIDEVGIQEALRRVNTVVSLMKQSENRYFKEAVEYLAPLQESGSLTLAVDLNTAAHKHSSMKTTPSLKDNKVHWSIFMSAEEILNSSSAITLAIQLAHEAEHVRNGINRQALPADSLSPEEKLAKELERFDNPNDVLEEEARGYTIQSHAYIYAVGQGWKGAPLTNPEKYAADFIRTGSNVNNPSWKNYVKTEILARQNFH